MIEQYLSGHWALEPGFHDRMAMIGLRRLEVGKEPFVIHVEDRKTPYAVSIKGKDDKGKDGWGPDESAEVPGYKYLPKVYTKSGQVVVIPIMGAMSRYGDMCSWGSEDITNWIMEANQDTSVSSIVLEINSPGGQVDGTQLLGDVVRRSKKPVVAWVAGMAASAAYWVASQAREIMMESETTSEVGSIGVLAVHIDATAMLEKEGYKVTIVRADGSPDKALFNSYEPLSEEIVNSAKTSLNLIRTTFVKTVQSGRPQIDSSVFTGKMYPGKDAIKLGMADRIGYLGDAIQRADLLARKQAA